MTWGRDTDEHEATEQLTAFAEAGGTLVDTAPNYSDGDAERLIGRLLGGSVPRNELVIATKAGVARRGDRTVVDTSRKAIQIGRASCREREENRGVQSQMTKKR